MINKKLAHILFTFSAILFLLLFTGQLGANNIKIEQLSTREGLSNGNVNWITQDNEGYLWISTADGLNKYDGYGFTNYRFDPDDPFSISANWNNRVFADSTDNLWLILSTGGITRYNKSTNCFYRYALENAEKDNDPSYAAALFNDSRGDIWIGTFIDGLYRIRKTDDTAGIGKEEVTHYYHTKGDEKTLNGKRVFTISEDANGNIWVFTENGLTKITTGNPPAETIIKNYKLPGRSVFVSGQIADNGKIYIASYGNGMVEFDIKEEKFRTYKHNKSDDKSISSDSVNFVTESMDGEHRWVFTSNGVNRFSTGSKEFKRYRHDPGDSSSIASDGFIFYKSIGGKEYFGSRTGISRYNSGSDDFSNYSFNTGSDNVLSKQYVKFIDMDDSGIFWVGTSGGGLFKFNIMQNDFDELNFAGQYDLSFKPNPPSISAIYKDTNGVFWLGSDGNGLLRYSPGGGEKLISMNTENSGIRGNWISSISEDKNGKLWIGTKGKGVSIYDRERNSFTDFPIENPGPGNEQQNLINDITIGSDGNVYIGTSGGLLVYNPVTNTQRLYKPNPEENKSIGSKNVWVIYEDRDEDIWIGTAVEGNNGGLSKFDKHTGTFVNYIRNAEDSTSINNQTVNSIYEGRDGTLWIGTYSGGLNAFDKDKEIFKHYTVKNGLPSNTVNGILEDREGNLWLSTNRGITKFDPADGTFINYDNDDGISGFEYNRVAVFSTEHNNKQMFLLGSKEGMDSFYPEDIKRDQFIPPVVISSFKVLDNPVTLNALNSIDTVRLSYDENFFSFEFASLDFDNPGKNVYKYMLAGFDKEWINSNTRRYAGYTNIEPGTYTFTVKGTNSDGVWNDAGKSVVIIISPPFWNTWWFYLLAVIAVVSVTLFLINLRIKRKVNHLIEIEKVKASERELVREEASRDYHDELGHKLTRISLFSRRILRRVNGNNGLREDLKNIVETSNSLQSGAKDLIWALNPEEDSMYDVCVRLRDFGNELFENSGIEFESDNVPDEYRNVKLSMTKKRHIIYIFKEGMTNVLKHSRSSEVRLKFTTNDEKIVITLSDNGIGFNPNNGQKGYGIKNIINRSKHIECKVEITSDEDNGTLLKLDVIP